MKYGLHIPLFGEFSDASLVAELAAEAERHEWDGFFTWDHISPPWHPLCGDTTVTLTAIAAATERIRLGPMMLPLARRRPHKVARETIALDRLSNGRLMLGAGIGGFKREFGDFGDQPDPDVRAEMVDEALQVLTGLWSGEPFSFAGEHYRVGGQHFLPTLVQEPRVPILVAATWSHQEPLVRAAAWDGIFPSLGKAPHPEVNDRLRSMLATIRNIRGHLDDFIVFRGSETSGTDREADRAITRDADQAGATWWIENLDPMRWGGWDVDPWPTKQAFERIRQGPPR